MSGAQILQGEEAEGTGIVQLGEKEAEGDLMSFYNCPECCGQVGVGLFIM